MDNIETGQRYLDGWVIDYNLFRQHEGIDFKTPAEAAKVNPPFKEWEDVVKASPPDDRARITNLREARARLADAEMPPMKERPGVKFIGFSEPGRKRSRSPLVRTPARKVSPPAGRGKVAAMTTEPKANRTTIKGRKRQSHTYAKTRRNIQRSQRQGR